jgi:hypothetical protein
MIGKMALAGLFGGGVGFGYHLLMKAMSSP